MTTFRALSVLLVVDAFLMGMFCVWAVDHNPWCWVPFGALSFSGAICLGQIWADGPRER